LTFIVIARHFVDNEELVVLLTQDRDADEGDIWAMVQQVKAKGYSPPRRDRILEWQSTQDFQICPNPDDPDACNVYSELEFPDELYESIQEYQEKKSNRGLLGSVPSCQPESSSRRAELMRI
jgi:hypothetical protein